MLAGMATDMWKSSLRDYLTSARELYASMEKHGFLPSGAVPIDPNGELLNGAHRVACALALGIESLFVTQETRQAWAPAWDFEWFKAHGMPDSELERLQRDFNTIAATNPL